MTVREFMYHVPLFLWIIYTKGILGKIYVLSLFRILQNVLIYKKLSRKYDKKSVFAILYSLDLIQNDRIAELNTRMR